MKKYLFLIILTFSLSNIYSQVNQFGEKEDVKKNNYQFAVRIIPNNYGVTQFFVIKTKSDNSIEDISIITKQSFVLQAMGKEKSEANPYSEDFFIKYEIFDSVKIMNNVMASIFPIPSDQQLLNYQKTTRFNNQVQFFAEKDVENLWKLRYAIYPYEGKSDTLGWTKNWENSYMPKAEQMLILKNYGLQTINGFIFGDKLFFLLKDMFMKDWVMAYMSAGEENN